MAKYEVTLADGRTVDAFAQNEAQARHQAEHEETTRVIIQAKRELPIGPNASSAVSVKRIKD